MTDLSPKSAAIRLRGVRQNNLKGIDIDIPLGKLIVVTGLSGAGKSSLVFETLHAEGQRRYVETFSPYTRQFLDMLDRPDCDSIVNIRPSIAIEQSNTVKTSRSTVGTMTELCDFFKVWFRHVAKLYSPDTEELVEDDSPQTIWRKASKAFPGETVLVCFRVQRLGKLTWAEVLKSLVNQGYSRVIVGGEVTRIDKLDADAMPDAPLFVIQDRVKVEPANEVRMIEALTTALHFGKDEVFLYDLDGNECGHYSAGLHDPKTGKHFEPAQPALFSFNSPVGACPECRGFGRVITIDYRLVIPDQTKTLRNGAIRPFSGEVYHESQKDLLRACKKHNIRTHVPWCDLTEEERAFVLDGEQGYEPGNWMNQWYGVRGFFNWLESNTYKMHVRVFLSRFRAYTPCPTCGGTRLQPAALNWKWQGHTLPDLYRMPVNELLPLVTRDHAPSGNHQVDIATEAILARLGFLDQVGLGYLTLDRASRTLSGGEVERVNLTSCLGTSLVDTLFVLDEPSVGLHARDIDRLIDILRRLTDQGNTVVVVEHDEAIIRSADHLIEVGPEPGANGGRITFNGHRDAIMDAPESITGAYLAGRRTIDAPAKRRSVNKRTPRLTFEGCRQHNIDGIDCAIPLNRFVCMSGVSGSGKSTLLNNVVYQGLLGRSGKATEDVAEIRAIDVGKVLTELVLVDQSPVSRTPRSNAVLYCDAWEPIRALFAMTEEARSAGLTASHFSFNSGNGRCETCGGLGHERVEMQFMADVYVECPTCQGMRFKPEVLAIRLNGKSAAEILDMTVDEAVLFFGDSRRIATRLETLAEVGLGYLPLGQPLNTLSGGESQRLKLVKYLGKFGSDTEHALILLDEPTTGLHKHDVRRLIDVLQKLVEAGHSLVVIEHNLDVLKSADWIIEMGPEAGSGGGRIVFEGTPEKLQTVATVTSPFITDALLDRGASNTHGKAYTITPPDDTGLAVAEMPARYGQAAGRFEALRVVGAREHNLKNVSVDIPHGEMSVITGVSGSGKSTLAFDIVFAEGQRRFMESMSPYARQFVEQMPRPDIDMLTGIAPTVAIEQRVTHGTRKSTVATITEVAQYLRLLYARIGIQHSPETGDALVTMSPAQLNRRFASLVDEQAANKVPLVYLCAPVIRGRKGHHQPLADWALEHGFELMRVDGRMVETAKFEKLDRYREHDIELVYQSIRPGKDAIPETRNQILADAIKHGKGAALLATYDGSAIAWLATERTDPATGESFPTPDPKSLSWNSAKGWCPTCRGFGRIYDWMTEEAMEETPELADDIRPGQICPDCRGDRLNRASRAVRLHFKDGATRSMPDLLRSNPEELLARLRALKLDKRSKAIARDLIPEIEERLKFMDRVGLGYLTMDRSTSTLSGGEAQRIRLAAQLGSNLSGVLYVLDEPSIGLHARDNDRLLDSLERLRAKGNTLLIVEHDEDTMRRADRVIDVGPRAGVHGGEIQAIGHVDDILDHKTSLTAQYLKSGIKHPLLGEYRALAEPFNPRARKGRGKDADWIVLEDSALRNLKGNSLHLPVGRLTMVCGVSGAGKSTLIRDLLKPSVEHAIARKTDRLKGGDAIAADIFPELAADEAAPFSTLHNGNAVRKVIEVDQRPIGKTPRSTPATYLGAFDIIRKVFAGLPEAKIGGFTAGSFSFNTKGGRCEKCSGAGRVKLEMNFMPDTYVDCDACNGSRYGSELDEVTWHGKSIADVLAMTFEEAAAFFSFHSRLGDMMQLMVDTGLGYLRLGQSSPTLSGGEAQRLKLVTELAKGIQSYADKSRGIRSRNLYILEEPTIGLHLSDCEKLIRLLHQLVEQGHTVVVIEHHTDLIAEADYVVEVGPEGGDGGGQIIYQGPLAGIRTCTESRTAPYLKGKLPKRTAKAKSASRRKQTTTATKASASQKSA